MVIFVDWLMVDGIEFVDVANICVDDGAGVELGSVEKSATYVGFS